MLTIRKYLTCIKIFCFPLILILFSPLWAQLPEPQSDYINDFAHVLNINDYITIEKNLKNLREQTGIEMTLVTINSIDDYMSIEGNGTQRIESFTTILFNQWGVGNANTNNGVMILFSLQDRQVRIELGRLYSLKYDSDMQKIVELMLPYFKQSDYSQGLSIGVDSTIQLVKGESINSHLPFYQKYLVEILVGALVILCIFAGISCMKNGYNGWGWVFFTFAFFLVLWFIKQMFKGKGGGFGGGRSGGGGASGSW